MLRNFYLDLISGAATTRHLDQILAHAILTAHHPDLITATRLIRRLSDLSPAGGAASSDRLLRVLSSVPRPDLFLLNELVRSLPSLSSLSLFASLRRRHPHLRPDTFTYAFAAASVSAVASPSNGRALHALAVVDGLSGDPFVGSALADLYLTLSQTSVAEKVFDQIPNPDTVSWNTVVSGLAKNCNFLRSLKFFERMVAAGARLESTTLAVVLPSVGELRDLKSGMVVHCFGEKSGFTSRSHVVTGLISVYSKCGEIPDAEFLFESIQRPDLVARNAMISGYSVNGHVGSSVGLFKELLATGGNPNSSTMVGLIPVSSPFGQETLCQSLHGFSIKVGFDVNPSVSTAVTTVYSKLNEMEYARKVFDAMPDKTMASWNAMISGYAQNGLTEMAISLFKAMQLLKIQPNPTTVTSILSACAQLGALTLGKWVHGIITEEDIELNVYVSTALIDMYAKCGSISEARKIFDGMAEKNVVSWNAMISGYGLHGQGREALTLFSRMLDSGISPTGITYLSVIYSCSHGGLVEDGRAIFESMVQDHGIHPGPEHYACMVDLLGRAGKLNEAFEFIKTVPGSAGPGVWGALLGACMKHKETGLAQLASEKLFELEPENPGYYVLLSNIYSANRNYPEAAAVRQASKSRALAKTPGCTLIEVADVLHVFRAGDRSHPQTASIYLKLEALTGEMAEAGYLAETQAALYDVEEEEKEQFVRVHSEKLAIAFGLISTEPGSEIRIIKNLRVCLDCHNATKFISKITRRLIVVRDANRFHHFRDGACSCGDYW